MGDENEIKSIEEIRNKHKKFALVHVSPATTSNGKSVYAICLVYGFEIRDDTTTECISSNTWTTLNYLDIRDQKIVLKFTKEQIEITTKDSQTLFESICDILQRVLFPKELEELNFSRFNAYPAFPTPFSVRVRLLMLNKDKGDEKLSENEKEFDFLVKFGYHTFDLSRYPTFSQTVISLLPLMTFVKSITVPEISGESVYQLLETYLPQCKSIKHIKLSTSPDSHFGRFLDTIIQPKSKITSLGFSQSANLTLDNLREIRGKIVNSRIHSLELNNAVSNGLSEQFYSMFEGQFGSELWSLNMNETKSINFNSLLPKLRLITSLSFEDCGIEINEFLPILCQANMQNLTFLNLNKNDCSDKIPKELEFPYSLTHISVDDVSWKKNSIVSFFEFFMKQKDEIHLSIARANSYPDQWENLFQFLSTSPCNIFRTLVWDRNPISEALLNFLRQNDKLSYLSLSGCFSNSDSQTFSLGLSLGKLIKEAENLKSLIVENSQIFTTIIDACVLHRSLSVLDLADSHYGNAGIGFLIPLIKAGKLNVQMLNIDGIFTDDQNLEKCIKLYKELAQAVSDVFVNFPQKDHEKLFADKPSNESKEFQLLFKSKTAFLSNIKEENEQKNYTYKKFRHEPFYWYPLNHYSPEAFLPPYIDETDRQKFNMNARKMKRKAEKGEEEEESEFTFANNNETMKFSEVPQKKFLKAIVKDMPSKKSPNDLVFNSLTVSEFDQEYSKNQFEEEEEEEEGGDEYSYYSTYTTANEKPAKPVQNKAIKNKDVKGKEPQNKSAKGKNPQNYIENSSVISELDKQKIDEFKQKYEIDSSVPFPEMKNPTQLMDEKWDQIDQSYSLGNLFTSLKNQKNIVNNK